MWYMRGKKKKGNAVARWSVGARGPGGLTARWVCRLGFIGSFDFEVCAPPCILRTRERIAFFILFYFHGGHQNGLCLDGACYEFSLGYEEVNGLCWEAERVQTVCHYCLSVLTILCR